MILKQKYYTVKKGSLSSVLTEAMAHKEQTKDRYF